MADNENKNRLTTIPIKSLKSKSSVNDSDILVIEDETTTYKTKASDLLDYTRESVKDTFVQLSQKGVADGVVPLDSNSKIDSTYLSFGETAGKIYDGKKGKDLEATLVKHKTDTNNPHKTTKAQIGLGNVENKDSETIRSELTYKNVTDALGFIPEVDGTYENATKYVDKRIGEVIGGASSTMNTLKEVEDAMKAGADVVEALNEAIGKKANEAEFESHVNDGVIHVTTVDKENISTALSHSKSDHARVDATKTEESTINGNIKINEQETIVYEHPLSGAIAGTYRQVTVDSKGHVTGGNNTTLPITQGGTGATTAANALKNLGLTATASELNKLDGTTVTTDELNYSHGVKSNIQDQLDEKAAKDHGVHLPSITSESAGKILSSDGTGVEWHELTKDDITNALGYVPGTGSNIVTAVKGDAEEEYKTGNVNITPASIGLDKVDNTKDNQKAVLSASKLSTARKVGNASFNGTADISLEDMGAMTSINPVGTGNFSLNREADTVVGNYSFAEGYSGKASGTASHAEGYDTEAGGHSSHAEGCRTAATGDFSHAEGYETAATGDFSHVHGCKTTATQNSQFVVGYGNDNQTDSVFEVGNGLKGDGTAANDGTAVKTAQNAFRVTQAGEAIAQTGLGIGDTKMTESQLRNLLVADGVSRFDGIVRFIGSPATDNSQVYNEANVVAVVMNPATDNKIRAGYGFHNAGINGLFLYLDTDGYLKMLSDTNCIVPKGNRVYAIAWKESETQNSRPQILVDGTTWVEIPTYNEISYLLTQSPYSVVFNFDTNGYMDSSKYRYLLYDAGDGKNFAGIGANANGDIIFKTGTSSVPYVFKMKSTGGFEAVAASGTVGHYREDSIVCNSDYIIQTAGVSKAVDIRASQLNVQSSDASAWASVCASAFAQQSSRKYKDNIADLTDEDALKLLDLRPVKYDYINTQNGTGCYGLIAEEVAEVMTYPVVYDANGNPDGIDYSKFVPLIIKFSQIQEDRINKLEKENTELKARLDKLEAILTK